MTVLYCSFCGRSQDEVKTLIAGPSVFICDECVAICNKVLEQEKARAPIENPADPSTPPTL